jgi:hypothetical protein
VHGVDFSVPSGVVEGATYRVVVRLNEDSAITTSHLARLHHAISLVVGSVRISPAADNLSIKCAACTRAHWHSPVQKCTMSHGYSVQLRHCAWRNPASLLCSCDV